MKDFDSIESAIEDIKIGKMVIVVDDEDRENEGDFVMAAEMINDEAINFMARFGRGMICAPISNEIAVRLDLDLMVKNNMDTHKTAFTVTVDSAKTTTGISAADRSQTIKDLVNPESKPMDLKRPGHIFPLVAKKGGVLQRAGHTEAAVDLSSLAGFSRAGVICEIMNEDGTMARRDQLLELADHWNMKMITIKDLIEYRRKNSNIEFETEEENVKFTEVIDFPNKYGEFKLHMFESNLSDEHHLAMVKGDVSNGEKVLVRVHSECFTGDIFGSLRCECGEQLEQAMKQIEAEGRGVLVYLRQEGRGIGLPNKIKAYALQDKGFDTVEANKKLGFKDDLREYGVGAQILKTLGVKKMKLMTNNPRKIVGLEGFDLEIVERVSLEIEAHDKNLDYLKTKKEKLGHMLELR